MKIAIKIFIVLVVCTLHNPFLCSQDLIDSLPVWSLKGKVKRGALQLRIVPYHPSIWNKDQTFQVIKRSSGRSISLNPDKKSAADWVVDTAGHPYLAASYTLNFGSDQNIAEELPRDHQNQAFDYTSDEIHVIRYLYNFLACNQDEQTAWYNGLAMSDESFDTKAPAQYILYTVNKSAKKDSSILIFDPGRSSAFSRPPTPQYRVEDQLMLEWPAMPFFNQYYAYAVEKSYDGQSFFILHEGPVINFVNNKSGTGYRSSYFYSDTLQPGKTTYYRLKGYDYFGDLSEPGESVKIEFPVPYVSPLITGYNRLPGGMDIRWEFNKEDESQIQSFSIWVSDSIHSIKTRLVSQLPPQTRNYFLTAVSDQTKFYFIETTNKMGISTYSFPVMAVGVDNTPPASPIQIDGLMDVQGVVQLHWAKNKESDILGYRVFRSVDAKEEFSQITVQTIDTNFYQDSLPLNILNTAIYYKVAAIDQAYNQSLLSPAFAVQVFDTVPPAPPSFYDYKPTESGIQLKWYGPADPDVDRVQLYKRSLARHEDWIMIHEKTGIDLIDSITDDHLIAGEQYAYTLLAIDRAGNTTTIAKPLIARALKSFYLPDISGMDLQYIREKHLIQLNWNYKPELCDEYWIYKKRNNEPLTLLKVVPAIVTQYEDAALPSSGEYTYSIKAIDQEGRESKLITRSIRLDE